MEEFDNDFVLDDEFNETDDPWTGITLAGFWPRVGASFIDGFAMAPVSLLAYFFTGNLIVGLFCQLVYPIYKIYMEAHYGATLGKMALQLRVVNKDAGPIDLNQSMKRYLFYGFNVIIGLIITVIAIDPLEMMSSPLFMLQGLSSLLIFVSVIFVLFDEFKQALHDKFAETYVVLNNRKPY